MRVALPNNPAVQLSRPTDYTIITDMSTFDASILHANFEMHSRHHTGCVARKYLSN
jgi:hypothetical protein